MNIPPTIADYSPAKDYLILKPELEVDHTESGIFIPEQARRVINEGEIIKCGPLVPDHLKTGMMVVFTQSSEYKLKLDDGSTVLVVSAENIILFRDAPTKKVFFPARQQLV